MSWRKIPMKFPGICIVCNQKIDVNEVGLWSKGLGVKHEKCAAVKDLMCVICGGPTGCSQCEFQENCDIEKVSQLCICKKCNDGKDIFKLYQVSIGKKFLLLNPNSSM